MLLQLPPPMPWYWMVLFAVIALALIATSVRDLRAGTTTDGAKRAASRALRGDDQAVYTGGKARLISGARLALGVALLGFVPSWASSRSN